MGSQREAEPLTGTGAGRGSLKRQQRKMNDAVKSWGAGLLIAVAAGVVGFILRHAYLIDSPSWFYPGVSLVAFAVGIIGRIGWKSQTWGGESKTEKTDRILFLIFYFIGIAAGVASLPGV